jgi:hypothetical protein
LGSAIELKLSQNSKTIPSIQPPKSLKSKQLVKAESRAGNGTDYRFFYIIYTRLMNYRINMEISPSSSSLDLTDFQDIQNPPEHANTDADESEPEETFKYPPFSSSLSPRFIEFTKVFPQFPKTHPDGYATVIEIDESILNKKALLALKRGCQYSIS